MATRGRIKKVNMTTDEMMDVIDINYSSPKVNITSDVMYGDNDIAGPYVDPDYCEGNTDEERKTNLVTLPLQTDHYRNYGGTEGSEGEPEIYFKSVVGTPFIAGDPTVELMPQTQSAQQYLVDNQKIIGIAVPPKLFEVDKYTSPAKTESKMLVDITQSAMLRDGNDDVLNDSSLGVKVGLDYLTGPSTKDAVFSYNITVYYGDIPVSFSVGNPNEFLTHVAAIFVPKFSNASDSLGPISNSLNLAHLFDYLLGNKTPVLKKVSEAMNKLWTNPESMAVGTIFQGIALYTTMILVADSIWNFFSYPTKAIDGIYQYKNLISGMYTWDDIKKTKYQIGFGRLFDGTDDFSSKLISRTKDQNIHTAAMNSAEYPMDDAEGRKKYANFKFFPKANQYDLMTPPPVITFKVELEAISGCHLSTTKIIDGVTIPAKPTAFVVAIAPDKYMAPVFDVITPLGRSSEGKQNVYINTPIIFQNARYVDFLALLDLNKNGSVLGLFPTYDNRYINSDGDQGMRKNKYMPSAGNNITTEGGLVFGGVEYPSGNPQLDMYPDASDYDVPFMQEGQGNLLYNPSFRLEQQFDNPDDPTYLLRKFWNYDSSWQIRDGAIYRDSMSNATDGVWQSCPKIRTPIHYGQYCFIEIECVINSGHLAIDLLGTFDGAICNWLDGNTYYKQGGHERSFLQPEDYPTGITLEDSTDRLWLSGEPGIVKKYKVLVRVGAVTQKIFRIVPDESFTGMIKYACLQRMPTVEIDAHPTWFGGSSRGCTNALVEYGQPRLQVRWMDAYVTSKSLTFVFQISEPTTIDFSFTPNEDEVANYSTHIDYGEGEPDVIIEGMIYQPQLQSHLYSMPGVYTVTLTNNIPASDLQNLFESFTCNAIQLIYFTDNGGLLANGSVDLSDTNLGIQNTVGQFFYMPTDKFKTPLYSLEIQNTPISGDCSSLSVVTHNLNISNTGITGDLTTLFDIAHVDASYSKVTICSGTDIPTGNNGDKSIIWKNTGMDVEQLYNLIHAVDLSNIESTTDICLLDIKGDNPPITDQDMLDTIDMLMDELPPDSTGREWNILYNVLDQTYTLTVNNGTISMPSAFPEIGDLYGGGIVSYIEPDHSFILVISTEDIGGEQRFCFNDYYTDPFIPIAGISYDSSIGNGSSYTDLIIADLDAKGQSGYAAKLTREYNGGEHNDWYLPSAKELDISLSNLRLFNINFIICTTQRTNYWSSSSGNWDEYHNEKIIYRVGYLPNNSYGTNWQPTSPDLNDEGNDDFEIGYVRPIRKIIF